MGIVVVVGLGHVGTVTAARFLNEGHTVIGVEKCKFIRNSVARGISPFREPGLAALLASGHADGRLCVQEGLDGSENADFAFVCVGTRGLANGAFDLSDVAAAGRELGQVVGLRSTARPPMLLVFRSTLLPASLKRIVLPSLASVAGEPPGRTYEVAYYPTFTREGSAVADEANPARIIIGERQPGSAKALVELLCRTNAPVFTTSIEAAALTKLADNAFHALKVVFANEIGRFALQSAISPEEVFRLFRADKRLNISEAYLEPGAAFGGPCLPKDVQALVTSMHEVGVAAPVLRHILSSNALHTQFLVEQIEHRTEAGSRILLLGLSFKAGTDDLRGSPLVAIADALLDRKREISIYDPDLLIGDACAGQYHSLPPRLLATLLPHLPLGREWDLVVVGKKTPDLLRVLGGTRAVLHIDRF